MFCWSFCPFVLFLLAIMLSLLLRYTDSDYPFDICWPLCCLSFFDIRILITPLVSVGHCVVCPSIYGFRLPLWYLLTIVLSVLLRYTDSDYPFGIFWPLCCLSFFDIWILITPLVSSNSSCISYHNGFFAIHQVVVSPRNNGQYRYNTYLILIGFIKL